MAKPGTGHGAEPGKLADDGTIEAEEQLTLADEDERLPWLESDDDYEEPAVDTGRIVAFGAISLLALIVIIGAVLWFTSDPTRADVVADGSTIEAPDEPYKVRPDEPGGQQVAGTGETSFEVAEGNRVEGRIAGSGTVPAPSIDREQAGADETEAGSRAIGVQVGAYSTREQAEAGWSTLAGRIEALQGRSHRILQGTADSGTIYRLQALAGSVAEAETLCRTIKSEGGDCQVKR